MKKGFLILVAAGNIVHAGIPVWTFTPLTPTSISIPSNGIAVVQYTITNQSKKTHRLVMDQIQGVTQDTSGSYCKSPFTLASKESCVLKLNITQAVYGGPIICEQIPNCTNCHLECYQPSPNALLSITQGRAIAIGDYYGGGKVACLNGGLDNLIAASVDYNGSISWGGDGTDISSAQSQTNGSANTIAIVNTLGPGTYAAKFCSDYAVDAFGNACTPGSSGCYDDWFLPAMQQLNCLYTNSSSIGGFSASSYWSSNNYGANNAEEQNFANGFTGYTTKTANLRVRCVRNFTL